MSLTVKNMGGERLLTGDSDVGDVKSGKTFYSNDAGTKKTGTFAAQEKTVNSSTTAQTVTPDSGKYLSKVTVNPMVNKGNITGSVGVGDTYESTQNGYVGKITVNGPILSGNADVGDVKLGKTFYKDNGTIKTGTMPNRGSVGTQTIRSGGSYTIQEGYHNGQGKVQAESASSILHFPDGYQLYATALGHSFPSNGWTNNNLIPICVSVSKSGDSGNYSWNTTQTISINGSTAVTATGRADHSSRPSGDDWYNNNVSVSGNNIFLPQFYGFNFNNILNAKSSLSGYTCTVWLLKR